MRIKIFKYCFLLFIGLFISCSEPPVSWYRSFDSEHKIPYGTYVLHKEMNKIFPESDVQDIKINTYRFLTEKDDLSETDNLYITIGDDFYFDKESWNEILKYVNYGGTAFISYSREIPILEGKLELKLESLPTIPKAGFSVSTVTPKMGEYFFDSNKGIYGGYFSGYNKSNTEVLGHLKTGGKKYPNFIKVYYGHGYFLLHSEPAVFTNYHMLKENHYEYITDVFSYVQPKTIYWDNYNRSRQLRRSTDYGGLFDGLSFIMKNKALRYAFLLLLALGFLYLVFNSKRRQKPIPVVLPYPNYNLDFAKTLSELYRYNPDHTAMVRYKTNYFLEQLRKKYNITSKEAVNDFSELLSAKSGVDKTLCSKLVTTIDIYKNRDYLDKEDFFKLQSLIEEFNHKTK